MRGMSETKKNASVCGGTSRAPGPTHGRALGSRRIEPVEMPRASRIHKEAIKHGSLGDPVPDAALLHNRRSSGILGSGPPWLVSFSGKFSRTSNANWGMDSPASSSVTCHRRPCSLETCSTRTLSQNINPISRLASQRSRHLLRMLCYTTTRQ